MGAEALSQIIRAAMSPAQAKNLKQRGMLDQYVESKAEEMSSEVITKLQEMRRKKKWDNLPPMELVRNLNTAAQGLQEQVLAEMLDGSSPESPEETGDLGREI